MGQHGDGGDEDSTYSSDGEVRSGEVFAIDQLWEMVYADENDSIAWATAFIRDRSSSHPKAD